MNRSRLMSRWLFSLGLLAMISLQLPSMASAAPPASPLAATTATSVSAPALDDPTYALSQYKVDLWQTEQGLPLNTVQALLQTRDGNLWVGTAGGLARFRRCALHHVPRGRGAAHGLRASVWLDAGPRRRALDRAQQGRRCLSRGQVPGSHYQPDDGRTARLGICSSPGRLGLGCHRKRFAALEQGPNQALSRGDGLPTDRLRALAIDRQGVLWIATTGGGLVSFTSGHFEVLNPDKGFPHLLCTLGAGRS